MKTKILYTLLLCCFSLQLFAQSNSFLVGTWILEDKQAGIKEMKIISPTHVGYIVMDNRKDSMLYAGFGTYSIENDKYVEHLEIANYEWDKSKKLAFNYKVEGDKFYQTGSVTFADGRTQAVNNTFTRVKLAPQAEDKVLGTWKLAESSTTLADGTKRVFDATQDKLYRIITPTHMFQIRQNGNSFHHAGAGIVTFENGKYTSKGKTEFTSTPQKDTKERRTERLYTIKDGKLHIQGTGYVDNVASGTWSDVMEKVETSKTLSTK